METDLQEELKLKAARGDLVRVQQIMGELGEEASPQVAREALNRAAWKGHSDLVHWLCGEGHAEPDLSTLWAACRSGDLVLVRWVNEARGEDETLEEEVAVSDLLTALERACDAGNLEIAKYLRGLIPSEDWSSYFPDDGDADDIERERDLWSYAQDVMSKYNGCIDG
jgi:hypothetical protein